MWYGISVLDSGGQVCTKLRLPHRVAKRFLLHVGSDVTTESLDEMDERTRGRSSSISLSVLTRNRYFSGPLTIPFLLGSPGRYFATRPYYWSR